VCFGLLQETETEMGSTHHLRYKDLIREVQRAEEMGFDYWGTSEQHFVSPLATVTAPEVLYGAVAAVTSRINLRHMVVLLWRAEIAAAGPAELAPPYQGGVRTP